MNNGDTARTEMRRARSFLEYANDDLSLGRWARAMSSSYYAAFHAAKAVLALVDIPSKSHSGLNRNVLPACRKGFRFPRESG